MESVSIIKLAPLKKDDRLWAEYFSQYSDFDPKNKTRYPLNRRLGETQTLFWLFGEEKFSYPYWDSNPGRPIP